MKKKLLYLVLTIALPFFFFFSAVGQETEDNSGRKDRGTNIETEGDRETGTISERDTTGTTDTSLEKEKKAKAAKKDKAKKAERKKKENKKKESAKEQTNKEDVKKEASHEQGGETESGENLLLIDNESIKYNRIPGITIKKDDIAEDSIVKIPNDKLTKDEKKEESKGGLFGRKTDTIAKWGLLIFLFLIFIIYKARAKRSHKRVGRTLTKR